MGVRIISSLTVHRMNDGRIPKDIHVWRAGHGTPSGKPPHTTFQGLLKEGPEKHRLRIWWLGTARRRSQRVAPCRSWRSQGGWEKMKPTVGNKKRTKEEEREGGERER